MTAFRLPATWPSPADPSAAVSLAEDLAGAAAGTLPEAAISSPEAAGLIACLGGNSPYLSDLARRERDVLAQLSRQGPARAAAGALRRLRSLRPDAPRAEIRAGLRRAKRQVALIAAIADIGGLWSLEQVTGTLSLLAEAALRVATAHLLLGARQQGLLRLRDPGSPERDSGFVILGMGKLGARELNYSSDIDLVLLYDPALQDGSDGLHRTFARLAVDLVSLMEAPDGDGYVFRMDLRLRPDPGTTPPAISLPSAIAYYEGHGQTWERAAMIKARPVAGDLGCGERFLEAIRPFVWRRHLDFAAIEDIHAMKRRIDRHKPAPARSFNGGDPGDPAAALLGHDVKLGHGGIREIEFIAQTLQLVWGGREPALRDATTLGALSRLAAGGYLKRSTADSLAQVYRRLRRIEHRLQMQGDRQTHSLPASRAGFAAFALFMGEPDGAAFARALLPEIRRTRVRFERMFRSPVRPGDMAAGDGERPHAPFEFDAPDLAARLQATGFPPGAQALEILRGWSTDRYRALRQPRARALLHGLAPMLLQALAGQRDPPAALIRFDALLSRQGSGVQLLSLFERNPMLLERIAMVLGAAPSLADHLALVPGALDGLLMPDEDAYATPTLLRILDGQMRRAHGVEEAIRIARTLVRGEEFRLSVAQMEGRLDVDRAGIARTVLAERVIARMLDHVQADHRARYGSVRGGGLSVVALGKAGSRETMSGSDLDLMLIYDHPEEVTESGPVASGPGGHGPTAPRALAASQYYARLAHGLIGALSAPGVEGPLYALDMRLRPSGNKGPVAVSLAAFRRYHAERAWTWERMALSRARVVAGPAALRRRVTLAIGTALAVGSHDPAGGGSTAPGADASADPGVVLRRDAAAMRARLMRDLPPQGPWDVKLRAGGLMEVEFIAQILQLASPDPMLRHPTTRIAFRRLARAGMLPRADAAMLIEADRFWRALQGMLRILLGVQVPGDLRRSLPEPVVDALLRGLDMDSAGLDGLEVRCARTGAAVREVFLRLVGPLPAA